MSDDLPAMPTSYNRQFPIPENELTIFDKENPRSLINIVWVDMKKVIERAEVQCREYFRKSERQLKNKVKPEIVDDQLRMRFWQEYDRAQMNDTKMMLAPIIHGLCGKEYFHDQICKNPEKLAWILMPLGEYITRMESSLYIALDEIEDILRLPIKQEKARRDGSKYEDINVKLIAEKVKIAQWLDLRIKGAIVQKLAIHQKVEHSNKSVGSIDQQLNNLSLTDLQSLDRSIANVQRQIQQAQSRELLPAISESNEVIDVSVVTAAEDSGGD